MNHCLNCKEVTVLGLALVSLHNRRQWRRKVWLKPSGGTVGMVHQVFQHQFSDTPMQETVRKSQAGTQG